MYRYNYSVHFYLQDDKIVILSGDQNLKLGGHSQLYAFLVYCVTRIHIFTSDLEIYNISEMMLQLLLQYKILLCVDEFKTGIEAFEFHQLCANPNKLTTILSDSSIDNIYNNYAHRLKNIINNNVFLNQNILTFDSIQNTKKTTITLGNTCFHSTRLNNSSAKCIDLNYLLSSLVHIHSKYAENYLYASGGGFYSVFSLVITSEDKVLITDKNQKILYTTSISGIYREVCTTIISSTKYDPIGYNAVVLLVSDTLSTFQKYGNRGYRFIMIESGAIGFLWRMLYSERGYIELSGYRDKDLMDIIRSHQLFSNDSDLIITHLLFLTY